MEYNRLGKTGLLVSELSFGTMTFGNEADEKTSHALMERALAAGINFIDGAHNYNLGKSEEILGRWIGPHRDQLILTSKVFFPCGGGKNDEGISRRNLIRAVEKSLKRLNTDYIDIVYLHHWDENVAIEQSMAAMNTLVEQGKVHYVGVSNFSAWQTLRAQAVAEQRGLAPISVVQPMYSLVKRQVEVEIIPMCEYEGFGLVPYNALGAGLLTGKYLEGGTGRLNEAEMYRQRYDNPQYVEITKSFVDYAKYKGISPAALALGWVNSHPVVTSAIFGARSIEQFDNTLTCLDNPMTLEQRREITAMSIDPPRATDREDMSAMKQRGW